MRTNTLPLEAETRVLIDRSLENLGWKFTGKGQNVFLERPKTTAEQKKLSGKRADYILYSDNKPIIVIEAKRKGSRLDAALEQGVDYARAIEAPLVFATDGVFCKSFHTIANRPPILNGEEVDEFIREALALRFLTNYQVNTVSPKVQYDRKELIRIFDEANNMLRGEGLRAGIERFGEFANILFLKLVSESEQQKKENGAASMFDDSWSWEAIKRLSSSARIKYINDIVCPGLNGFYDTEIFTPLQLRNESILAEIMDKLDPLMLTDVDSDVKGDAFEYFLKASTSTKNDLGEYFTPRHIVKTMVRLVNPQIGEKIYDPFCGTGGFLIECFRYIYANMPRNPDTLKLLREQTIFGNEITNTARITKMNMILAGDGHSNIEKQDSLENPVDGLYDIVLANIPYSQKTKFGGLYDIPSSNGDSICVQHCLKAINGLSENGRMALVVPEGFLFRKDLTKTREYLLDRCQLQSIISLPQGVFLPYTGVKTDIIFATKVNQKLKSSQKRKDFWYFDVKSDGYTLDNHRRKLSTPSDLSKYEEYRKLDEDQTEDMLKVGFEIIPLDKVRKNSSILVGSRYREQKTTSAKSCIVSIGDIFDLVTESVDPTTKSGSVRYVGLENIEPATGTFIGTLDNRYEDIKSTKRIFRPGDILFGKLRPALNKVAYATFEGICSTDIIVLRAKSEEILPQYYSVLLRSEPFNSMVLNGVSGGQLPRVDIDYLLKLPIQVLPKEVQAKAITELDEYQRIIVSAKKISESYTPHIHLSDNYSIVKLGEVCSINEKSVNPEKKYGENNFTYIDISSVEDKTGNIDKSQTMRGIDAPSRARRAFHKGDILFSTVRPNLKAFTYIDFETEGFVASTGFAVLTPKKINGKFLLYMLLDDYVGNQLNATMSKAMYPSVNKSDIENLNILLPSEDEQEQIVKSIEAEIALIKPTKDMISLFTQKIKDKIDEAWGEKGCQI